MYDVILLTQEKYLNPDTIDWYTDQVLTEDLLVMDALTSRGLKVEKKDWADPNFDWSQTKIALFRTTWDYFHRYDEFSRWMEQVKDQTQVLNHIDLIKWNVDKHYLADLENKGVRIVESYFIETGDQRSLKEIVLETGWNEFVLKPVVSGAARHTYKLGINDCTEHESIFSELIAKESMMIQPFMRNIVEKGEVSLMLMGGQFTHAVLKKAKSGDYRVQDDWGGTVHDYHPSREEISFAENAVRACPIPPVYARVDMVWNNQDEPAIGELELIEPELWFRKKPDAALVLADHISRILKTQRIA